MSSRVLMTLVFSVFLIARCLAGGAIRAADAPEWFGDHVHSRMALVMLQDEQIGEELSIPPDKRKVLGELLRQQVQEKAQVFFDSLRSRNEVESTEERRKSIEKHHATNTALEEKFRSQIWNFLEPSQRERFAQIVRQLDAAGAILHDRDVNRQLKITREQRLAVDQVMKQFTETTRKIRREKAGDLAGRPSDEYLKAVEAEEDQRSERALKLLTDKQRAGWSKLIGEPIDDVSALRSRTNILRPRR